MSEDMKVALPFDEDNSIEEASAQMPVGEKRPVKCYVQQNV